MTKRSLVTPSVGHAGTSIEVAVGLKSVAEPPPEGLPGAVWTRSLR